MPMRKHSVFLSILLLRHFLPHSSAQMPHNKTSCMPKKDTKHHNAVASYQSNPELHSSLKETTEHLISPKPSII